MIEAVFLNPLTKSQLKSAGRKIRSGRLKKWLATVKKHGGDMTAAAKEWKSHSGSARNARRSAGGAGSKRRSRVLSGIAARRAASSSRRGAKGGVPMAARTRRRKRRRRRNQFPPSAAWTAKWMRGMTRAGRTPKRAPRFRKISSDTRTGRKQWKRRYTRGIGGAMLRHGRMRHGGARSFSRAVRRGVRRSPKLMALNPMTYETWVSRFRRGTGYTPYARKLTPKRRRVSRRRRGPRPMTRSWRRKVVRGLRSPERWTRGVSRPGAAERWYAGLVSAMGPARRRRAANPVRRRRRRRMRRRRYPILPAATARRLALGLNPRRKRRSRRSRRTGRFMRRRNPVASSLKAMVGQDALMKYLYVTGGVAVGAVIPGIVSRYIWKGEKSPMVEALIGVGGSLAAGLGVSMATKNDMNGILVAAGGLAGVVGNLIAGQLQKALGFSGFGASAENALKAAVEKEMERAGLKGSGVGQFLLPGEAEDMPGSGVMGQFLTEPELQESIAQTSGFGQADLDDSGTNAFAGIDGSVF